MGTQQVLINRDPFLPLNAGKPWRDQGLWPCFWIDCPDAGAKPFVTAYRLRFTLDHPAQFRAHVTADERYILYLNGEHVGRGPERGDPMNWFFQTYGFDLPAGDYVLAARVWSLGEMAGHAQMSAHPGFLFAPEGEWTEKLGTGHAQWETKRLDGYSFTDKGASFWREAPSNIDGSTYPWGVERGEGSGWAPVRKRHAGQGRFMDWEFDRQHILTPSALPPMMEQPIQAAKVHLVEDVSSLNTRTMPVHIAHSLSGEAETWQAWLDGKSSVTVPPQTTRRILIGLDNYYCAYTQLMVSGGAGSGIRMHWAESLYVNDNPYRPDKGNRAETENKYFIGRGYFFWPDGGDNRVFAPLWWECGLYIELVIQTANEPLTLNQLTLLETRYPVEMG
ncbi:MAG: alpha-L-rhamnosidase, partial [Anaerolineae bacterium]|nr:alpha-L-rhamnosidase [Anaerolineae bacterium]